MIILGAGEPDFDTPENVRRQAELSPRASACGQLDLPRRPSVSEREGLLAENGLRQPSPAFNTEPQVPPECSKREILELGLSSSLHDSLTMLLILIGP